MQHTPSQSRSFFRFFAAYAAAALVELIVLYVDFLAHPFASDPEWGSVAYRLFTGLVIVPGALLISALVLRRSPRNVTGLFLILFAVFTMRQGTLRVGSPLQPFINLLDFTSLGMMLLPVYFPDGLPFPPRFGRWIRLHSVGAAITWMLSGFFIPTVEIVADSGYVEVPNPLMITGLPVVAAAVNAAQVAFFMSSLLLIIVSLILRFRASRGLVRQQIKWFVWVFAVVVAGFGIMIPLDSFNPADYGLFGGLVFLWRVVVFPAGPYVAVGYAILRHRLYDIDIIIRRTLVYSTLTAILALVYFGGVALMQSAFVAITGQESPLAVVASTLGIAALFTPVRRRVQAVVDRRFYRRKYDAEKTVDAFARAVRDEVDMDRLRGTLLGVVEETMQPTSLSLWVKEKP